MNWIQNHQDAIVLLSMIIVCCIVLVAFKMGQELGYREGLEDGFKDGELNAPRS